MRIFLSAFVMFYCFDYSFAAELRVGSDSPPLKIEKWLKGQPINEFQPGQIYIIEFWATWCLPCIKSIPHLNEIARRYADSVTVIGVAAYEQRDTPEENLKSVANFLKKDSPSIDYRIGFDGTESMSSLWMTAAEKYGIPTVFVVDRNGKVVFIGGPWDLDSPENGNPLDQIVKGTWLLSSQQSEYEKTQTSKRDIEKKYQEFLGVHFAAEKNSDWPLVLANARNGKQLKPYKRIFQFIEAEMLIKHFSQPAEGVILLKDQVEADWKSPQALGNVLALLLDEKVPDSLRDMKLAKKLADRVTSLVTNHPDPQAKKNFMKYQWLLFPPVAKYYHVSGQPDMAVVLQETLMKTLSADDTEEREKAEADLKKYKEAAASIQTQQGEVTCKDGVCELRPKKSNCSEVLE